MNTLIETLDGERWEFNGIEFTLNILRQTGELYLYKESTEFDFEEKREKRIQKELSIINKDNLSELELYGVRVLINEPVIYNNSLEMILLEQIQSECYFFRNHENDLFMTKNVPLNEYKKELSTETLSNSRSIDCIQLDSELFPFIKSKGHAFSWTELNSLPIE